MTRRMMLYYELPGPMLPVLALLTFRKFEAVDFS